jgi:hypothetical protein
VNIYEISNEYRKVFDELSEMEGLSEEIIKDTLSPITANFQDKAIAETSFFKNLEAEVKAMKTAEKNINERRKSIENKIEKFKNHLKSEMMFQGINKISCPYFCITLAKSKSSVNIIDLDSVPKNFIKEEIKRTPMKDEILKNGGCEGAEICETYSLRIK